MRRLHFLALLLPALSSLCAAQEPAPSFRQLIREAQRLKSVGNLRGASAKYGAAIEAAENDPELAEALHAHAVVQRGLGRDEPAEAELRRAIALPGAGSFRRPAMLQLAALLEEQDRLEEAITLYRNMAAALRDSPEDAAEAILAAARLLVNNDRLPEARAALADLQLDALPTHLRGEAANLRLEVSLGTGDVDAARAAIREAGVEGSDLAQLHVRLARILLDDERLPEATEACDAAIAADPGNASAWRLQFDIAVVRGTEGELLAQIEADVRADPLDETRVQRLAYCAEWDGDTDRALRTFNALAELRPDDANLLQRAGARAAQGGRQQEALGFYEAALALEPDDPGLCFLIGEAHAKLGNRPEAVAALKRGARYRAGDPEAARRLGMTLVRAGLYDEAAAVYRETRDRLGDPSALAAELAEALAPVHPEEALAEYVQAAAAGLDDADFVAPEAVKLARSADLLPRLAELTASALQERPEPGLALLMAITQAARGSADSAVRQAAALGLPPDALMRIAESLEVQGAPEAAAEMYAAVVARPDTASGLRLELGLRAAETDVAVGRPDAARAVLEAALQGQRGPQELAERAAFLLADLDLAAGRDLAGARAALAEIVERSAQPDLARRARWRLADVAFAQGDYPAAEPQYQALAAEAPSLELELPPPPPGLMPLRNGLFLPPGFDPGDAPRTDPRTTPAYAAFQLAECAFRRADFDRAKALFAGVSEAFPDSVYANDAVDRRLFIATHFSNPRPATEAYVAALSRSFTDDWPAAAESLRGLAASGVMEPLSDDAALQLAALLEAHGKPAEAAAEYRALPDTFPGSLLSPEALLRAARLARSLGDEAHAREDLDRLLRNYPTAPMAKTAALWLDDLQQGRPWPAQ